jgi:hypothetical protein
MGEDIHIVGSGVTELFIDTFTGEDLEPAKGDLSIGPGFHDIGSIAQDDMEVVGKNGVGEDIDPEDGGEFLDPLSDPFFSVGEVFSGDLVEPAEVCASDASLNDVEDRNLQWGKNLTSFRSRHSKLLRAAP